MRRHKPKKIFFSLIQVKQKSLGAYVVIKRAFMTVISIAKKSVILEQKLRDEFKAERAKTKVQATKVEQAKAKIPSKEEVQKARDEKKLAKKARKQAAAAKKAAK